MKIEELRRQFQRVEGAAARPAKPAPDGIQPRCIRWKRDYAWNAMDKSTVLIPEGAGSPEPYPITALQDELVAEGWPHETMSMRTIVREVQDAFGDVVKTALEGFEFTDWTERNVSGCIRRVKLERLGDEVGCIIPPYRREHICLWDTTLHGSGLQEINRTLAEAGWPVSNTDRSIREADNISPGPYIRLSAYGRSWSFIAPIVKEGFYISEGHRSRDGVRRRVSIPDFVPLDLAHVHHEELGIIQDLIEKPALETGTDGKSGLLLPK